MKCLTRSGAGCRHPRLLQRPVFPCPGGRVALQQI